MTPLLKDKIPLSGTDQESIIHSISMVLKMEGVVRINIDARTSMIDFWRVPAEHEVDGEALNPFRAVLKNVQMEEYVPEKDETPERQFFSMCEMLEDAGCVPVFLLSGRELTQLRKTWIAFPRRSTAIGGVPILPGIDLMEDTVLLCGSKFRDAEPVDVSYVVKLTL